MKIYTVIRSEVYEPSYTFTNMIVIKSFYDKSQADNFVLKLQGELSLLVEAQKEVSNYIYQWEIKQPANHDKMFEWQDARDKEFIRFATQTGFLQAIRKAFNLPEGEIKYPSYMDYHIQENELE